MKDKTVCLGKPGDRYILENPEILESIFKTVTPVDETEFTKALESLYDPLRRSDVKAWARKLFDLHFFGDSLMDLLKQTRTDGTAPEAAQILNTLVDVWYVKRAFEKINKDPAGLYNNFLKATKTQTELIKDSNVDPASWRAVVEIIIEKLKAGEVLSKGLVGFTTDVLTGKRAEPKKPSVNPHNIKPRDFATGLFVWLLHTCLPDMPIYRNDTTPRGGCLIDTVDALSERYGTGTTYVTINKAYRKILPFFK